MAHPRTSLTCVLNFIFLLILEVEPSFGHNICNSDPNVKVATCKTGFYLEQCNFLLIRLDLDIDLLVILNVNKINRFLNSRNVRTTTGNSKNTYA
jgi:hypothetical protein